MGADAAASAEVALREGRWTEARDAFAAALARGESARALAGMGTALWWLDEAKASVDYHERAYAAFRRCGEAANAATVAISLSITQLANFGNYPAALGWFGRAERAAGERPEGSVHRWLVLMRVFSTRTRTGPAGCCGRRPSWDVRLGTLMWNWLLSPTSGSGWSWRDGSTRGWC